MAIDTEQANTEIHELARQIVTRIEKFGTLEGFADTDLMEIIKATKDLLEPLPALIEVTAPTVVFGDIHGQLADLLQFVKTVGRPPERQFLFLGDYVDRASRGLEVISWLFCMKVLHPQKVHLLRGNHEVRRVNAVYGFRDEMLRKRNDGMWKAFNDAFAELPLCASINRKILCMHGGISPKIVNWKSLTDLNKARIHGDCELGLTVDLMWADPNRVCDENVVNMKRGISLMFAQSTIEDLCDSLDIDMVIRAHEVKANGHEFYFDKRLLTVFSAPYYSGNSINAGSVATISRSLKLQIVTLKPRKPHELMVQERENREANVKNFQPLSDERDKKVTCRSNFPVFPPPSDSFVGNFSMCAHDTKSCKKEANQQDLPAAERRPVPFRRGSEGYGTVNLKDELMDLAAIREKIGLEAIKDDPPASANTPSSDTAAPVPEGPSPPPPPKAPEQK